MPDAATLPYAWYSEQEALRNELARIFGRSWQYVAHADEVARPGDYVARTAGHVPVVVVRDEESALSGYVNVCRHRGHEVASGAGNRRTLQCGYHAWTYGLDGALRSAPRSDREDDFDRDAISLLPVRVATFGPLVFVNPDEHAAPLDDVLGDLPDHLAAAGVDLSALRFRRRIPYEAEANWKVVIENYLECYHCPVAHPAFTKVVDVDPDAYTLEASEWFSSQTGPARNAAGEVADGNFFWIWPNTRLNVFPGRPNLSVGAAVPAGPGRTRGFFDYFFGEDVPDDWAAELIAFDDQVGREDRALVESVQRGVSSGLLSEGRLLLASEHLIAHFHALVRRALGQA